jgi:hypothetical protein
MEKRFYPAGGNAARDARFLSYWALKCQSGQAVLGSFWPAKAAKSAPTLSLSLSLQRRPNISVRRELDHSFPGRDLVCRLVRYEDVDQDTA